MSDRRDQANRKNINDQLDDERFSEDYSEEEDGLYSDEMEFVDEMDSSDPPNSDDGYQGDDYPEDDYPENLEEDDLEDTSTDYAEGELHDEQRTGEKIVNDLDLGEALYYEKDSDYHHIDGPEEEEELDEEEAYDLGDPELEERLVREQVEEHEEENES